MHIQSSLNKSDFPKKDVSFLKDKRISITKLYDDMAILLRKFEFSGKKYSPSKISKAKEILSRIYNFTQSGQPYVGWWVYMCEKTGLSRPTVMQYFKDFREAGLVRYELTFYKGKPVTYIHTTEVIDCFFMQIASGEKDDNIIVNDMIKFNQTQDKNEKIDIEKKQVERYEEYVDAYELKKSLFMDEKTGETHQRLPSHDLKPISLFGVEVQLSTGFKLAQIELEQFIDANFSLEKMISGKIAGRVWQELLNENNPNAQKAHKYVKNEVEAKKQKSFILNNWIAYIDKQLELAINSEKTYHGITGARNFCLTAIDFINWLANTQLRGYYEKKLNTGFKTYTPNQQQPQTVATGINVGKIKTQEQVLQEIQEQRQMVSDTTFNEIKEAIKQRAREDKANATTSPCPPSQRFENAKKEKAKINAFECEKLGGKEIDTMPQHKPKEKEPTQVGNLIGIVINSNKN